jgi:hypothetical protein
LLAARKAQNRLLSLGFGALICGFSLIGLVTLHFGHLAAHVGTALWATHARAALAAHRGHATAHAGASLRAALAAHGTSLRAAMSAAHLLHAGAAMSAAHARAALAAHRGHARSSLAAAHAGTSLWTTLHAAHVGHALGLFVPLGVGFSGIRHFSS